MKISEIITWILLGILLIWFFKAYAWVQIIIGLFILIILLVRDSIKEKAKDSKAERASHETFYDAMKWVAFLIFIAVYTPLINTDTPKFLITAFIFILVLFGINFLKERNAPNRV